MEIVLGIRVALYHHHPILIHVFGSNVAGILLRNDCKMGQFIIK